jgi:hypothetical protein
MVTLLIGPAVKHVPIQQITITVTPTNKSKPNQTKIIGEALVSASPYFLVGVGQNA